MTTITELRQKQEKLAADAKAILSQITSDTDEGRAAELNEQADKAFDAFDKLEARIEREQRAADMAARLNASDARRPVGENRSARIETTSAETTETAFRSYLLNGFQGMSQEQRSLLMESRSLVNSKASNAAGAFTVPTTLANELIVSMADYSPMLDPGVTRQLITDAGETMNFPTNDDTAVKAAIVGENAEVTAPGALVFGQKGVGAFKYSSGLIKVSTELAQDSILNMEAEIRRAFSERMGRGVGEHLTVGTGTTQPWGIVTRSAEGFENALVGTGSDEPTITFDDLIELEHSVDAAYRRSPNVAWQFNDRVLKLLRKVKDGEGRFIWQPAQAVAGAPASILGYRYVVNPAMADLAFDARPVIFGDMSRYVVRRVRELAIRRLDERYAEFGQIAFIGFARFDGELLDNAAIKHLLIPSDPA